MVHEDKLLAISLRLVSSLNNTSISGELSVVPPV